MVQIDYLTRCVISDVLTVQDVLERVHEVFEWVSTSRVEQTTPRNFWLADAESEFGYGVMSAYTAHVKPLRVAGIKWLGEYLHNTKRDLPTVNAVNIISDTETALPLAILDGGHVTAMRTAGHAGVGALYLADEHASTATVVGCGQQAETHLLVMDELFDLSEATVCGRSISGSQTFIDEMGPRIDTDLVAHEDPAEAVSGADVVCMVTTSDTPVVQAEWIDPGCHVAATAGFKDLDPRLTECADKWVVGSWERDLEWIDGAEEGRYGPSDLSADDVHADIPQLIRAEEPGRERDDEITVMTHMGMPALDIATSALAYAQAESKDAVDSIALFGQDRSS